MKENREERKTLEEFQELISTKEHLRPFSDLIGHNKRSVKLYSLELFHAQEIKAMQEEIANLVTALSNTAYYLNAGSVERKAAFDTVKKYSIK